MRVIFLMLKSTFTGLSHSGKDKCLYSSFMSKVYPFTFVRSCESKGALEGWLLVPDIDIVMAEFILLQKPGEKRDRSCSYLYSMEAHTELSFL